MREKCCNFNSVVPTMTHRSNSAAVILRLLKKRLNDSAVRAKMVTRALDKKYFKHLQIRNNIIHF